MKNIILLLICFTSAQSFGQAPKLDMEKVRKYMENKKLFLDTTAAKKSLFLKRIRTYNAGSGSATLVFSTLILAMLAAAK